MIARPVVRSVARAVSRAASGDARPFTPLDLFASGEQGTYSLPPNAGSYFTDTSATTPAALTDAIALVQDESGNGIDWIQATATARPVWAEEAGFAYLSFDLLDDKLTATLPAGTYTVCLPTRQGIWFDSVTHAGGAFDVGPTTYTGGPAGILTALESDGVAKLVAMPYVGREPTAAERNELVQWYQSRGAELFEMPDDSTLSLDFLSEEYYATDKDNGLLIGSGFDNIISFTRASGGGRFNHLGVYEWVGSNVPRIDHDPATVDTSTSSVVIGSGLKTFAVSRLYPVGEHVRATADASNWMAGRVVESTGSSVTLWVDRVVGTGTHASWTLIRVLGLLVEEQRTTTAIHTTAPINWTPIGSTITALAADRGFFPVSCATNTGSWHRHRLALFTPATSDMRIARFFYKIGTSGLRRLTFTNNSKSAETSFSGTAGQSHPAASNSNIGTMTQLFDRDAGDGLREFAVALTFTHPGDIYSVELGPFSTVSGETIIIYGGDLQVGTHPASLIYAAGSTVTRAEDLVSRTLGSEYNPDQGRYEITGNFRNGETVATLGSVSVTATADGPATYVLSYDSDPGATELVLGDGTFESIRYYPEAAP